jgi:hypothetical protein
MAQDSTPALVGSLSSALKIVATLSDEISRYGARHAFVAALKAAFSVVPPALPSTFELYIAKPGDPRNTRATLHVKHGCKNIDDFYASAVFWSDSTEGNEDEEDDEDEGDCGGESFSSAVGSRRDMERDAKVYSAYLHLVESGQSLKGMRKLSVLA